MAHPSRRSQGYDAHIRVWKCGRLRHDGKKLLDYHGVREVVNAEMSLETIFGDAGWDVHHSCVAHQDIKTAVCEFRTGFLD